MIGSHRLKNQRRVSRRVTKVGWIGTRRIGPIVARNMKKHPTYLRRKSKIKGNGKFVLHEQNNRLYLITLIKNNTYIYIYQTEITFTFSVF